MSDLPYLQGKCQCTGAEPELESEQQLREYQEDVLMQEPESLEQQVASLSDMVCMMYAKSPSKTLGMEMLATAHIVHPVS